MHFDWKTPTVRCPHTQEKEKAFYLKLQEILNFLMQGKKKGPDKHFIVYYLEIQVSKAQSVCEDITQRRL